MSASRRTSPRHRRCSAARSWHDDLTVIPGIGPNVEQLCHGIGIRTWYDLATTEASLLRTMLVDAGPRFSTHDPSLWPEMARLLSEGRWQEFEDMSQAGADSNGR